MLRQLQKRDVVIYQLGKTIPKGPPKAECLCILMHLVSKITLHFCEHGACTKLDVFKDLNYNINEFRSLTCSTKFREQFYFSRMCSHYYDNQAHLKMEIRKRNKMKNDNFSLPVTFDGGLQSCVRAKLISELLKYIMYERQQIPLPFEQVKRDLEQKIQTREENKVRKLGRSRMKKAVDMVNKLEHIIQELEHAFHICPEIKQAAIAIGATIVSPKEVFLIQLPPLNPDADNLSGKACVKSLFRQLIMQDPLRDVKQISPSNITLLLLAPRNSNLSWFYPKATYKLPVRGRHFEFCLHSNCGQGNPDLSTNFSVVELSGFNPFESVLEEPEVLTNCSAMEENSPVSEESVTADYVCIDSDHDMEYVQNADISDASINSSLGHSSDTIECIHSDRKRMKKFDSKSSILSRSSVLGSVSDRSTEFDDKDSEMLSVNDSEFIWFKSPLVMKGYRNKF